MSSIQAFRGSCSVRAMLKGASLLALAIAAPAYAQDKEPPAPATEAAGGLDELVVTAQRREQALNDVPVSVQAFSAQQLEVQSIEDTASLVKISPAIAFTGGFSSNSSGFVIRGITSASSEGGLQQSTAMVIDGVPLARPGEFLGDLGDIARVEVLRGPQGTLFGKNATAGVISLVTKRPERVFAGYVEGSLTSDGEILTRTMLNVPLGSKVAFRANGYWTQIDPIVRNLGSGGDIYEYERYGFAAKLDFDLDAVQIRLSGDYRNSRSSFGQAVNVVPSTAIGAQQIAAIGFTPRPGLVVSNTDGLSFDKAKGWGLVGEIAAEVADGLTVTSISGYRDFRNDNQSDVDNTPAGFVAGRGFSANPTRYPVMYVDIAAAGQPRQPQHVDYISQELRLNWEAGPANLVAGVFFQDLNDNGAGITPFIFDGAFILRNPALAGTYLYNATQLYYSIDNTTYAAFADVTYDVTNTVSLFGGLRYTNEKISMSYRNMGYFGAVAANYGAVILPGLNGQPAIDVATGQINLAPISSQNFTTSRTVNNVSGRAGVQWEPSADLNFYASFNRGYKGPAADVSRGSSAPTATYSPLLNPEIATSYELGAKMRLFDGKAQLNVNLFSQEIKDVQQAIVLPSTVTQLINAGNLRTDGVEVDFQAQLFDGFLIDAGGAYTDPRYSGNVIVNCYSGQTSAQGCNVPVGAGFFQNLNGAQTVNSYKWRLQAGATYKMPIDAHDMDMTFHVGYQWFDDSPQRLDTDPMLREPSHGLLNASLTIAARDRDFSVQIFGKNLTDDFYYAGRVNVDNLISRVSGYVSRDFRAYGGIKVHVGF